MSKFRPAQTDPLLLPSLRAHDAAQEQRELDELISIATPRIRNMTRWARAADDAFQESMQLLIEKLRRLKSRVPGSSIRNYHHYISVVSSHVVKGEVRQEHPEHRAVQDALRHLLKRDPALGAWRDKGQTLCGLREWRQENRVTHSERLMRLLRETGDVAAALWPRRDLRSLSDATLVTEIFRWVGHPMRVTELVTVMFFLKGIERPWVALTVACPGRIIRAVWRGGGLCGGGLSHKRGFRKLAKRG